MNKIKETITALSSGEFPGAVQINRKEHTPITDERLAMIIKCIIKVASVLTGTVIVINAEIAKLGAMLLFAIFFSLVYFASKD